MSTEEFNIAVTGTLLALAGILNMLAGALLWRGDQHRAGLAFIVAGAMFLGAGMLT